MELQSPREASAARLCRADAPAIHLNLRGRIAYGQGGGANHRPQDERVGGPDLSGEANRHLTCAPFRRRSLPLGTLRSPGRAISAYDG